MAQNRVSWPRCCVVAFGSLLHSNKIIIKALAQPAARLQSWWTIRPSFVIAGGREAYQGNLYCVSYCLACCFALSVSACWEEGVGKLGGRTGRRPWRLALQVVEVGCFATAVGRLGVGGIGPGHMDHPSMEDDHRLEDSEATHFPDAGYRFRAVAIECDLAGPVSSRPDEYAPR